MKKFILILVGVTASYLVYNILIKKTEEIQVEGNLVRIQESASLESPGVSARNFGYAEGTVKNMTDKTLKNIVINYMIDRQISSANFAKLNPREEIKFRTNQVMIRVLEPPFYLENVKYE